MRASISDVLLFRKCPRAWFYSTLVEPATAAPALERGTEVHKKVADLLSGGPALVSTLEADIQEELLNFCEDFSILGIETGIEYDFRGHTVLCRPDGVLKNKLSDAGWLWQLKTSTRNCSWHSEIVRISPHEAMYAEAAEYFINTKVVGTIVCRYIVPKTKPPYIIITEEVHDPLMRAATLDGIAATLDEMEKYANVQEGDTLPPAHTNACIDWFSGSKCPYYGICHQGVGLNDSGYKKRANRYPEFAHPYTNAGGSGSTDNASTGGSADPDYPTPYPAIPPPSSIPP